jgi:hypothetical protein
MPIFKCAFLLRLTPKHLIVAVGIEGRINVDQIHTCVRQLAELVEAVSAINDPRVQQG